MLLNKKSNYVAVGGICTAVSLVMLFVASVLQVCQLGFVFVASVIVGTLIVMYGYKLALCQYVAVSILAVLIVPDKNVALLYALVVGNYPAIKFVIDKIKNKPLNFVIKMIVFNVYMVLAYLVLVFLIDVNMSVNYPLSILWLGMLAVFYVYDYIYAPFVFKFCNILNNGKIKPR